MSGPNLPGTVILIYLPNACGPSGKKSGPYSLLPFLIDSDQIFKGFKGFISIYEIGIFKVSFNTFFPILFRFSEICT